MISRHRIKAYMLRHVYEMWATFDRKFDIIFWPTIDLLIFGLLSIHVQKLSTQANLSGAIIGGLILWTLVYSVQRDISVSLLEDAWSRNLYNLFSTPLKAGEMLIGVMLLSIGKAIITVSFVTLLAWGLFGFKLFSVGPLIFFFIFNIFIFGWAFGCLTVSLIFRFGSKLQIFAWSLIALLYPISGVFYPLSILPGPLVSIAKILPLSYIFEGLREAIIIGKIPPASDLFIIMILNSIYLMVGIWAFMAGFRNAKNRVWFIHPS